MERSITVLGIQQIPFEMATKDGNQIVEPWLIKLDHGPFKDHSLPCPALLLSHGTPPPVTRTECSVLMGCQPQSTTRWAVVTGDSVHGHGRWMVDVCGCGYLFETCGRQAVQSVNVVICWRHKSLPKQPTETITAATLGHNPHQNTVTTTARGHGKQIPYVLVCTPLNIVH